MNTQPIAAYKGDTLRSLLLSYSKERVKRDVAYRKDVNRALAKRFAGRKAGKVVA